MKKNFSQLFLSPIEAFLKLEAASGIILAFAAAAAMIAANSVLSDLYFSMLDVNILGLSLQHWINDGLMTIFFFMIGMEIKKELLVGELSSFKKASLPLAAAIGGMVVPAAIYLSLNQTLPDRNGWGIPMATDIAFALGVLTLFGKRIPLSLKVFLLALAIVDDLGAILVIAFFYTNEIKISGLALGALAISGMMISRSLGYKSLGLYVALGVVAWFGVLTSGIHATIAGVVIGLLTPLNFPSQRRSKNLYSPLDSLVHSLHPWVSFGIMPIFAFANAGISLQGVEIASVMTHSIYQGVALGLIFGKPLGIVSFCLIAVALRFAALPSSLRWIHIVGVSFLGGIGFTMSIFISGLALQNDQIIFSKIGIIVGSLVAALIGVIILSATTFKSKLTN